MTAACPIAVLQPFLPAGTSAYVEELLGRHAFHVRLARPRRSKLGDHMPPVRGRPAHRISINDDLNPYAFLTTLLHEIAHAATWERHERGRRWGRRLRPHGSEWKREYRGILEPVVALGVLPADVEAAVSRSMNRLAAATCSDRDLLLALARYDRVDPRFIRVEEVAIGGFFRTGSGAVFRAGRPLRSRRQCFELRTGNEYRVHGLARVEPLEKAPAISGPAGPSAKRSGRSSGSSGLRGSPGR
jgi:SprT protein